MSSLVAPDIGSRLQVGSDRCTLLFVGPVEGTQGLWWGVEWDDPKRGKHDGEKDGIRYFRTRVAGAGSFIRPSSPKIILPKPFFPTLKGRYTSVDPDARPDYKSSDETLQLGGTRIEVEAPNLAKVRKRLENLTDLKELGVDGEGVGTMSEAEGTEMTAMGQWNTRSLNLSQSLFPSLEMVEMVVSHLTRLDSLNLNSNRFQSIPAAPRLPAFGRIKHLTLNNTLMSWRELMRLEPSLSTLESLEFSFNQVTSLVIPSNPADEVDDTSKRAPFPNLHHLRLDSNAFSSWADLDPISCFTALQTLSLTYNDLPSLPPPSSTTSSPFPSSLSSLSLSFNKIKTWSSIDVLGSLPLNGGKGLREVWVRGNGFVEGTPGGLVRSGLIARLRGLEVLEGSEVTPGERKDAELFYLSLHPTFDANDVGRKRWDELVMRYGLPDHNARALSSTPPPILRDKLLEITIQTSPTPSPSGGIQLRVLPAMSLRMLKLKLQKLTGMKAADMQLYLLDDMRDGTERREAMQEDKREIGSYGVESGSRLIVEGGC